MKLVLHNYWRSSASHRVRIGLELKGLPYDYVAVNIVKHEQGADAYRAKNPMMQVPTLEITEDDGAVYVLTQSLPILEYLEERFPNPAILPFRESAGRDVRFLRARARALAEIVNSGIQPFQNLSTTKKVHAMGGDTAAWTREFIESGLHAFQSVVQEIWASERAPFCAADTPTIADCCLVPQLASARRFGVDLARFRTLVGIEERCLALPAFQRAAPEAQPDAGTPAS